MQTVVGCPTAGERALVPDVEFQVGSPGKAFHNCRGGERTRRLHGNIRVMCCRTGRPGGHDSVPAAPAPLGADGDFGIGGACTRGTTRIQSAPSAQGLEAAPASVTAPGKYSARVMKGPILLAVQSLQPAQGGTVLHSWLDQAQEVQWRPRLPVWDTPAGPRLCVWPWVPSGGICRRGWHSPPHSACFICSVSTSLSTKRNLLSVSTKKRSELSAAGGGYIVQLETFLSTFIPRSQHKGAFQMSEEPYSDRPYVGQSSVCCPSHAQMQGRRREWRVPPT